ncbi:hypothetical protein ACQ4M3_37940 [Leptolyngbya sp. AN03gr2]|uniref:hypothetical protein n=1 Tax=unclassified Leptolyngbya TaxID=2650499 RepID=UPI003D3109F9
MAEFQFIAERDDPFLALFPHRYDYIWADYPRSGYKVEWKTESRHPLSDRMIQQGGYLYGVRFGAQTQYCLLDIDITSQYHPRQDPFAIARIVATLEPLGLVDYLACTSSYSGGLHLYFPFEQAQKSWELAVAVQTLLENEGFMVALGELEILPNPKLYVAEGKPSLYKAHRLPMQLGSYLVNRDWQPIYSDEQSFVQCWQFAQRRNGLNTTAIAQVLKAAKRKQYQISGRADKFLNDLNADIEPGWTGHGQTNFILGRIAMRSYIFGHLLYASRPLEGQALIDDIVATARKLPGYEQWCRHQHEIEHRAEEWACCIENSDYFHFGIAKSKLKPATGIDELESKESKLSWNQQQSEDVRERIRAAIADLIDRHQLPAGIRSRFLALTQYGISGSSLYKHRDLWHPNSSSLTFDSLGSNPLDVNSSIQDASNELSACPNPSNTATSLLHLTECNSLSQGNFGAIAQSNLTKNGCNIPLLEIALTFYLISLLAPDSS